MSFRRIRKNIKQMTRRLSWFLYRKNRILRTDALGLIRKMAGEGELKLHMCCGAKKYDGYVNLDAVPLEGSDAVMNIPEDLQTIDSGIASEILMESGFEHFYRYQQDDLLKECFRILKPGGKLVLRWIPDFDLIVDEYIKHRDSGGKEGKVDFYEVYRNTHAEPTPENSPHQLHKDIFTKDTVRELLERNGFQIAKLENGIFRGADFSISINATAQKP